MRFVFRAASRLINLIERKALQASIINGRNVKVFGRAVIENPKKVFLGDDVTINEGVYISGHHEVHIGAGVSLSAGCKIITAYLDKNAMSQKREADIHLSKPVRIGQDTQIGAGAIILPGVIVGERVIVGAGSVVTKNIPDDVVVVGVPARIVASKDERPD